MNQPTSLEEFVQQASYMPGNHKTLYVNQADYTPDEVIVSDEDIAGGVNMQMISLLAVSNTNATYWGEPFYDSGELEKLNIQLESLDSFSRKVITKEEMEETKSRFGIEPHSILDEIDPL